VRPLILERAARRLDEIAFVTHDDPDTSRWPKLVVTHTDGIGERKAYKFESQRLNDRMEAKVNVANGNLLLKEQDLSIAGTGLNLDVTRYYNSLSSEDSVLGRGWVLGVGHDVRLELNPNGAVFVAPSGYRVRFDKNADGSYSSPADPGIDATLEKRSDGTYKLEWYSKERLIFSSAGRWIEHKDRNDNTISLSYKSDSTTANKTVVSEMTDTRGRKVTFTYASGRLTAINDVAGGRTYAYGYDSSSRLASFAVTTYGLATDNVNLNATTSFSYDSSDRLSKVTDPRGNETRFVYDGSSRKITKVIRISDKSAGTGPTTTFAYSSTLTKCSKEEDKAVTETKVDGPRGDVEDFTWHCSDRHDRPVATFDAKGHKSGSKYTSNSNVSELNESGVAGGPALSFGYNSDNNLTSVSLPTGGQASMNYGDSANPHFPTALRDFATDKSSAEPTWAYHYDDDGNLIEAKSASQDITFRYCYNDNGTLDRIAPPPPGGGANGTPLDTTTSGSDCSGAAQNNDTLFSYNAKGELIAVDPPGAHATQSLTYDALSRTKTVTDGRGVKMTFSYDALDRVTDIEYSYVSSGDTTSTLSSTTDSTLSTTDSTLSTTESSLIPPDDPPRRRLDEHADHLDRLLLRPQRQPHRTF
jgi:YD repeat-containing protein